MSRMSKQVRTGGRGDWRLWTAALFGALALNLVAPPGAAQQTLPGNQSRPSAPAPSRPTPPEEQLFPLSDLIGVWRGDIYVASQNRTYRMTLTVTRDTGAAAYGGLRSEWSDFERGAAEQDASIRWDGGVLRVRGYNARMVAGSGVYYADSLICRGPLTDFYCGMTDTRGLTGEGRMTRVR